MAIVRRVSKKTGRVSYQVRPPKPGGGKEPSLGTFDKKSEARDAERDWESRRAKRSKKTGREWADFYLEGYSQRGLKSASVRQAKEGIRKWLKEFGNRNLTTIDRMEATEWARKYKGSVAPVITMMNAAVREEVLDRNVFSGLKPKSRGRKDKTPLTDEEVEQLAKIAGELNGEWMESFVLFMAYTGLRPGEVYVLEWSDIDWKENYVTVSKNLSRGEHGFVVDTPKNGRTRKVVMLPKAKEALLKLDRSTATVFVAKRGGRLTHSVISPYWAPVAAVFGVDKKAERYDLRHFCANHLLVGREHREYQVATQLGHTDGGTLVSNTYGHGDKTALKEIRDASYGTTPEPTPPLDPAKPDEAEGELAQIIPFPKAVGE